MDSAFLLLVFLVNRMLGVEWSLCWIFSVRCFYNKCCGVGIIKNPNLNWGFQFKQLFIFQQKHVQ